MAATVSRIQQVISRRRLTIDRILNIIPSLMPKRFPSVFICAFPACPHKLGTKRSENEKICSAFLVSAPSSDFLSSRRFYARCVGTFMSANRISLYNDGGDRWRRGKNAKKATAAKENLNCPKSERHPDRKWIIKQILSTIHLSNFAQ